MQFNFTLMKMKYKFHFLSLTMLFLLAVLSVRAEGTGTKTDPYIFTNGASYDAPANLPFYGKFTAPSDGIFALSNVNYAIYTDETFSTIDETVLPEFNGNYEAKQWSFICHSGETYYIGNSFVMDATTFTVSFSEVVLPLELVSVTPQPGSVFNTANGILTMLFNKNVYISSCSLTAGSSTAGVSVNISGAYATVDVKTTLNTFYNNGTLKEGDNIKFTFTGVAPQADKTVLYNGTGVVEVEFKAGPKPLNLVSTTNLPVSDKPISQFYSYYMSNDETAAVTLTFSDEVNFSDDYRPQATLSYGNVESNVAGEYYMETLEVEAVDSKTIKIDFRGKLRRHQDMVETENVYTAILLTVNHIYDKAGNPAYSAGAGTVGSYFFDFEYVQQEYIVDTDWELSGNETAIGQSTAAVSLWMNEEGRKMCFDGAKFEYVSGGETKEISVPMSDITVVIDGGERTIEIPIPNITIDESTTVKVSLDNVERPDGITADIEDNAMQKFTATFSSTGRTTVGINAPSVSAGDNKVTVYTLGGTCLLRNADVHSLASLAKGFYIVNGRKLIIR
ncbi:MAG: hypothetical protein ACI4TW_06845 [Prevotella sp.]